MLRRKRFWLSLIISAGCLLFFLLRTDLDELRDSFAEADYALAFAAVPLYFVAFWVRTMRWRLLLRPVSTVSTLRLYPVVLIGLMTNNVAPARVGELVRAYLLGERESMSKSTALGTIAVDRAFDGLTLVAILGVATLIAGSNSGVQGIGVATALLFVGAASVLVALALSPNKARGWLMKLERFFPERLASRTESLVDAFLAGLTAIRSPATLSYAAFFSVASWLVEGAMYWVVGQAFNLDVGIEVYLLILAGANLALSIIQTPGGVGPFEATTILILTHFSVDHNLANAYALVLHALLLGPVILAGLIVVWATQVSLKDIFGVRQAPTASTQGLE